MTQLVTPFKLGVNRLFPSTFEICQNWKGREVQLPSEIARTRKRSLLRFYQIISVALSFYLLIGVILNWDKNWMHTEMLSVYSHTAKDHPDIASQFKMLFARENLLEGRIRPLSCLVSVIDSRFRIWLWRWIPPHPSFSLVWFLSLGISPYLVYSFMKRYTGNIWTAWSATLLYFCSPGFLSGIVMLYHPAKPLATFFIVLGLYLASHLFSEQKNNLTKPKIDKYFFIRLSLILVCVAGSLTDESFWFLFILLPLLYPQLLNPKKSAISFFALLALPLLGLILFSGWPYPIFAPRTPGGPYVSFWDAAFIKNEGLRRFNWYWFLVNALQMLVSHFKMFQSFGAMQRPVASSLIIGGLLFWWYERRKNIPQKEIKKARRLALSILAFSIFQTILLTYHLQTIESTFYYGAPFSLLLSLFLGIGCTPRSSDNSALKYIYTISFMFLFLANFNRINRHWIWRHQNMYSSQYPLAVSKMDNQSRMTFASILALWNLRTKPDVINQMKPYLPSQAYALLCELRLG